MKAIIAGGRDYLLMFMAYNADLKRQSESESLLTPRGNKQNDTSLRVEILRHVVQVKLAESAAAQDAESR